jgi:predicted nucleotidyltransferase
MSSFTVLSRELDADERTLRRAARDGMVRARWISPRRAELAPGEAAYLRRNGPLLFGLRRALRTEPNVRLAVLFGSFARGDDGPASDIDLLVEMRDNTRARLMDIEDRLSSRLGRRVQLLRLSDATREPALLADAVGEGRVIVDRDGRWPTLTRLGSRLRTRAERDLVRRARRAIARAHDAARSRT